MGARISLNSKQTIAACREPQCIRLLGAAGVCTSVQERLHRQCYPVGVNGAMDQPGQHTDNNRI